MQNRPSPVTDAPAAANSQTSIDKSVRATLLLRNLAADNRRPRMTSPVTEFDTDLLAALVAARHRILELLVQLGRQQLATADAGATPDLLKLLAAKQAVLGQLRDVQRQLDPFQLQDPEARVWRSPDNRLRCQEQAHRCEELLAESMRLENEGESALARWRDRAASVLAGDVSNRDVHAAYSGSLYSPQASIHLHCEG